MVPDFLEGLHNFAVAGLNSGAPGSSIGQVPCTSPALQGQFRANVRQNLAPRPEPQQNRAPEQNRAPVALG